MASATSLLVNQFSTGTTSCTVLPPIGISRAFSSSTSGNGSVALLRLSSASTASSSSSVVVGSLFKSSALLIETVSVTAVGIPVGSATPLGLRV